jgi:acetyl esterase/lipase
VLWYPAVDLRHFVGTEIGWALTDLFGGPPSGEQLRAASPTELVHAGCPPVLTLCGDRDSVTPVETAEEFHRRLAAAGVENRLVVYPGKDHQFDLYPGGWEDSFAETVAFLERTVGPGVVA